MILLINPKSKSDYCCSYSFPNNNNTAYPNLGLGFISEYLRSKNIETIILDCNFVSDYNKSIKTIFKKYKIELVGISFNTFSQKYRIEKIIQKIKIFCKNVPIIIGGNSVSILRNMIFNHIAADWAIIGEGEISLYKFISNNLNLSDNYYILKNNQMHNLEKYFESKNMYDLYLKNKNQYEKNHPYLIKKLDCLPLPTFYNYSSLEGSEKLTNKTIIPIQTSRGCPNNCIFCQSFAASGKKYRKFSNSKLLDTIHFYQSKGFSYFEIVDDNLTIELSNFKRLLSKLSKLSAINIYITNISPYRLDEEVIRLMFEANIKKIGLSVEHSNDRILKELGKKHTRFEAQNVINIIAKYGILLDLFFLIGCPTETYNEFMNNLEFASKQKVNMIKMYNLCPIIGTSLWEWVYKNGYNIKYEEKVKDGHYFDFFVEHPFFDTPWFPKEERMIALKKAKYFMDKYNKNKIPWEQLKNG